MTVPLLPGANAQDDLDFEPATQSGHRALCWRHIWPYVSLLANSILTMVILLPIVTRTSIQAMPAFYSPAAVAVEKQSVLFSSAYETSPFRGRPTEAKDKLWESLWNVGRSGPPASRISADQARLMLNKTLPIPGDQNHYVILLSVFHQLHCLSAIRKHVWNPPPQSSKTPVPGHIDHCIDVLRETLQCQSDITPLTMAHQHGKARWNSDIPRQCSDFDKIRKWAKNHQLLDSFDVNAHVQADPLGWGSFSRVY